MGIGNVPKSVFYTGGWDLDTILNPSCQCGQIKGEKIETKVEKIGTKMRIFCVPASSQTIAGKPVSRHCVQVNQEIFWWSRAPNLRTGPILCWSGFRQARHLKGPATGALVPRAGRGRGVAGPSSESVGQWRGTLPGGPGLQHTPDRSNALQRPKPILALVAVVGSLTNVRVYHSWAGPVS